MTFEKCFVLFLKFLFVSSYQKTYQNTKRFEASWSSWSGLAVTNKEQRLGISFTTVATLIETKRKLEQKEILSC